MNSYISNIKTGGSVIPCINFNLQPQWMMYDSIYYNYSIFMHQYAIYAWIGMLATWRDISHQVPQRRLACGYVKLHFATHKIHLTYLFINWTEACPFFTIASIPQRSCNIYWPTQVSPASVTTVFLCFTNVLQHSYSACITFSMPLYSYLW